MEASSCVLNPDHSPLELLSKVGRTEALRVEQGCARMAEFMIRAALIPGNQDSDPSSWQCTETRPCRPLDVCQKQPSLFDPDPGWEAGAEPEHQVRAGGRASVLYVIVPELNPPLVCASPRMRVGVQHAGGRIQERPCVPWRGQQIPPPASEGTGVLFSEATAGGILGLRGPQQTPDSNCQASALSIRAGPPAGPHCYRPVVNLLRML